MLRQITPSLCTQSERHGYIMTVMMMLRLMVMLIMMVVVSRCTGSGDGGSCNYRAHRGNYETDMGYLKTTSSNSNVGI